MVDGRPFFLDDHAEIAVTPSTRQTDLYLTIIANSNSAFPVPFTLAAGEPGIDQS